MNNLKNYISERGGIYKQEELDEVLADQRQRCADDILNRIKDFPSDSNLAPWYECADICLNATGESDG